MSIEEIKKALSMIEAANGDDEAQHSLEDELYAGFVEHISQGQSEYAEMAKLILTTKQMDFARWCA